MSKSIPEYYPISLIVQLILCGLSVASLLYIPITILPLIAQTYNLSAVTSGYALSAFGFSYAVGFLVFGPLSDRVGRPVVMISGLLILAFITICLNFITTPKIFLIGRSLQGFAAATFPPVALAYLTDRGTAQQKAWGVAWMSTAFLAAGLLGQIYGSVIALRWGFGYAMLPLALIYILTAFRIVFTAKIKRNEDKIVSMWSVYRPIMRLLKDPILRRVYIPAFLLLMAFVAFYIVLDRHLGLIIERQKISPLLVRALAIPAFFAPLAVARLIPRWGADRVASMGLAIASIGLFLSAFTVEEHLFLLIAASIVFVIGVGISIPGLIARVSSATSPEVRGIAVSIYTFILFVGASFGPFLANKSITWNAGSFYLFLAVAISAATVYSASKGTSQHARMQL